VFIPTSTLYIKYILILLWKFQNSLVYLACHWLKNKIDLIFDLFVFEF